jgi:ankyrin repeat protein
LGKLSVVEALLAQGADVFRGNYNGETPLMRAALATTHYQAQSFESLLKLLRKSIRTRDQADKTVLHHLAHAAGALGRVPESNYYMEVILMWVGKLQHGDFSSLVDLKDENGDTALSIATRLGAKALAQTLLAVGASPVATNKFGLKPVHYGILDEVMSSLC